MNLDEIDEINLNKNEIIDTYLSKMQLYFHNIYKIE